MGAKVWGYQYGVPRTRGWVVYGGLKLKIGKVLNGGLLSVLGFKIR